MVKNDVCATGLTGLDEVLGGGLPRNHLYLIQGKSGTGKTTLAMQFLREGLRQKEKTLYITLSETKLELEIIAQSHGWDISTMDILELTSSMDDSNVLQQTTLFHTSEVELTATINLILDKIKTLRPQRIVFDSISELRQLADNPLRYRRHISSLKNFFSQQGITVLFLDNLNGIEDIPIQPMSYGVILLEKSHTPYGREQRRLQIVRLRGVDFKYDLYDYTIKTGGIEVFPRLIPQPSKKQSSPPLSSGIKNLDSLLGGGLDSGTSNLILGLSGTGKTILALTYALSIAKQGKKVCCFSFEENISSLEFHSNELKLNLESYINSGQFILKKINPTDLVSGEFNLLLMDAVHHQKADMVIIDSLNGYAQSLSEPHILALHLHEWLFFLNSYSVVTLMTFAPSKLFGVRPTVPDFTYLFDTVILTQYSESNNHTKKTISILKKRTGPHEDSHRDFNIEADGIKVGASKIPSVKKIRKHSPAESTQYDKTRNTYI